MERLIEKADDKARNSAIPLFGAAHSDFCIGVASHGPRHAIRGRPAVVVQLVEHQISNLNVCEFESRLPLQLRTFNSDGQSNCLLSSKSDGFKSPKVRHICAISSDGRAHDF